LKTQIWRKVCIVNAMQCCCCCCFSEVGCRQGLDPGPCREYRVMWYYDPEANACAQFWYGGCQGNSNRFETEDLCQNVCVQT
uniref:BPTI/Kunitz inhibitor domain-containing protein n=1 Tax=Sinocyclocheilus anshuiensis TaxID=1608454 RepID=A0A671N3F0_9TELE